MDLLTRMVEDHIWLIGEMISSAGQLPDEALDDTFVDALCDPPEVFTYGGMVAHVLTFAAHRRTLVALALDKHGIDR